MWLGLVKDYNYEILYYPRKANVAANAFSRKVVVASISDVCLRMMVIPPLLEQIREAQIEAMKEKHQKSEHIVG